MWMGDLAVTKTVRGRVIAGVPLGGSMLAGTPAPAQSAGGPAVGEVVVTARRLSEPSAAIGSTISTTTNTPATFRPGPARTFQVSLTAAL